MEAKTRKTRLTVIAMEVDFQKYIMGKKIKLIKLGS